MDREEKLVKRESQEELVHQVLQDQEALLGLQAHLASLGNLDNQENVVPGDKPEREVNLEHLVNNYLLYGCNKHVNIGLVFKPKLKYTERT